jgi:dihydroorotase
VGQPADATVVDPSLKWVYRAREGYSLSSNTPFEGREFTGRAALTVVGGEIRADNRASA